MMKQNFINKKTIGETLKFGFVGVLNTIVGYGAYFLLIKLSVFYMASLLCSHIIGAIHSYFWNKYFTFKSDKKSIKEIIRFASVYVVTFLINLGILSLLVERFKVGEELGGFIALVIVTGISFFGHKFWSFK